MLFSVIINICFAYFFKTDSSSSSTLSDSIMIIDLQQGVSVTEAHRPIKSEDLDDLEWRDGEFTWTQEKERETNDAINICKSTLYPTMEPTHILGWGLLEPSGCR